ncbi:MAG: NAD(P)H-hydrate epimerase [Thaumarchaeota archaeon]|nr:MAG: NAD(P)H-hydrate epimerase [Nitrososphaerota archaeon]
MPEVPALSSKGMAELDRRLVEDFRIDLSMMMENAGRSVATQARTIIGGVEGKRILVMAGKGNNGGGGMVAARNLHDWGARVNVVLATPAHELKELPLRQFEILRRIGVRFLHQSRTYDMKRSDLIIDALLGYNQHGNPRGVVADLVMAANSSKKPILCLDIPSGLDPDSGFPNDPCIRGTQTLTLALPKKGLVRRRAKPYVGDLFLADIGVPARVYKELGVRRPIFREDFIVRLKNGGP